MKRSARIIPPQMYRAALETAREKLIGSAFQSSIEDVASETVIAYEKWRTDPLRRPKLPRNKLQLVAWIRTTATNKAWSLIRKEKRRIANEQDSLMRAPKEAIGPDKLLIRKEK